MKKDNLQHYFYPLDEDFKYQSIASSMIENGLKIEDIVLEFYGQHERCYANEIKSIKSYPFNKNKIKFELRINGFYDLMPQTFFHDFRKYGSNDTKKMIKETAELKKEEAEIRNLFFPFEYFLQKELIKLELKEREIYKEANNFLIRKLFESDNNMLINIPESIFDDFYSLLQYSKIIQKNINYIKDAFEICLKEKISLTLGKTKILNSYNGDYLNEELLGLDFVCGSTCISDGEKMYIKIGPIKNWKYSDNYAELKRFVNILIDYFVPIYYDIDIEYIFDPLQLEVIEPEDENQFMLGYNTYI